MNRFTYYAACYGYRHCDPLGHAVVLRSAKVYAEPFLGKSALFAAVTRAVRTAIDEEAESFRCQAICDCEEDHHCESCEADLTWSGVVNAGRAKDLFTTAELREHRHALLKGEVVWLSR